jgi:Ca2+-binding EF-hand superfamily protein
MTKRLNEFDLREELIEAFKVFDMDSSGRISTDEIKKILRKVGDKVSDDEIEEVIRDIDPDETKAFFYEDYVSANWGGAKKN